MEHKDFVAYAKLLKDQFKNNAGYGSSEIIDILKDIAIKNWKAGYAEGHADQKAIRLHLQK